MTVWARKLVIARSLGKITIELKHSARRTALTPYPAGSVSLPSPEWSRQHPVDKFQLQRAVSAIDIFPRCALLLTNFEGLSLEDTAILLSADNELVKRAQAIGLAELGRNLACEQGSFPLPLVVMECGIRQAWCNLVLRFGGQYTCNLRYRRMNHVEADSSSDRTAGSNTNVEHVAATITVPWY